MERAASFVRSGNRLSRKNPQSRPADQVRTPSGIRIEHTLSFGSGKGGKTIGTGRMLRMTPSGIFRPESGWSYRESGGKKSLGIAIKEQEGIQSIVLIDRNRGTVLQVAGKSY